MARPRRRRQVRRRVPLAELRRVRGARVCDRRCACGLWADAQRRPRRHLRAELPRLGAVRVRVLPAGAHRRASVSHLRLRHHRHDRAPRRAERRLLPHFAALRAARRHCRAGVCACACHRHHRKRRASAARADGRCEEGAGGDGRARCAAGRARRCRHGNPRSRTARKPRRHLQHRLHVWQRGEAEGCRSHASRRHVRGGELCRLPRVWGPRARLDVLQLPASRARFRARSSHGASAPGSPDRLQQRACKPRRGHGHAAASFPDRRAAGLEEDLRPREPDSVAAVLAQALHLQPRRLAQAARCQNGPTAVYRLGRSGAAQRLVQARRQGALCHQRRSSSRSIAFLLVPGCLWRGFLPRIRADRDVRSCCRSARRVRQRQGRNRPSSANDGCASGRCCRDGLLGFRQPSAWRDPAEGPHGHARVLQKPRGDRGRVHPRWVFPDRRHRAAQPGRHADDHRPQEEPVQARPGRVRCARVPRNRVWTRQEHPASVDMGRPAQQFPCCNRCAKPRCAPGRAQGRGGWQRARRRCGRLCRRAGPQACARADERSSKQCKVAGLPKGQGCSPGASALDDRRKPAHAHVQAAPHRAPEEVCDTARRALLLSQGSRSAEVMRNTQRQSQESNDTAASSAAEKKIKMVDSDSKLPLTSPDYICMLRSCGKTLDDATEGLMRSYESDGPQFIRDEVVSFPPRRGVDELGLLQELFWPKYFNAYALTQHTAPLKHKLLRLAWTFFLGLKPYYQHACDVCAVLHKLFTRLSDVRELLKTDIHAAFCGDPASSSYTEIIRCYPGFLAITAQRVAHVLYEAEAPVYPRELTELAHRLSGMDIHPGAIIGAYFFADHATGTVIGETAVLGEWVRIYQATTIGALHFASDTAQPGMLRKGYKRHPTIGNRVVIGSGAKLLGPITIGDDVSIGANAWVQEDVPSCTAVFIKDHPQQVAKVKKPTATPPPPPAVVEDDPTAPRTPSGLARTPDLH